MWQRFCHQASPVKYTRITVKYTITTVKDTIVTVKGTIIAVKCPIITVKLQEKKMAAKNASGKGEGPLKMTIKRSQCLYISIISSLNCTTINI